MKNQPKVAVDWKIKNVDTGEEFLPPYPVSEEGVKWQLGGTFAEIPRFGLSPVNNWVGGKTRTFQFHTVLFAVTTNDSIEEKFKQLEALTEPLEDLGRPPICVFCYGPRIEEMVMVESVDVVVHPATGASTEHRFIDLDITLRRYRPFSQTQIDPTRPNKESYYLIASAAEASYEQIARRLYGSAVAGDRLRKRHPSMPMQPTVGAKVSVPAKSIILRETVAPGYHAFSLTDADATAVYRDLLDRRATRKVVI